MRRAVKSALLASVLLAPSLFVAVATGAAAQKASAAPQSRHEADAVYDACLQKDPSTAGMVACAAEAEDAWDKALNVAYRDLAGALRGRALEALKRAQRDWVDQRDREFRLLAAIGDELQGTMWGPVMAGQRVAFVKARALQLRTYKTFLDDGRP